MGTRKGNSGGALAMQVVGWVHVWLAGFAGHVGFEVMQPGVGNRQPWCPGPGHVYLPEGFAGCEIKSASQLWWQLSRSAAHPCTLLRHSSIHGIPRALQELGRKGAVGSRGVSSPWVEWALFALIPLQWGSSFIQHLGCPPPLEGPCFGGGGARDPHVVHRPPLGFLPPPNPGRWKQTITAKAIARLSPRWVTGAACGGICLQKYAHVPLCWHEHVLGGGAPSAMAAFSMFWVEGSNPIHTLDPQVLAQLLWRCFGVVIPPGKTQGCHRGLSWCGRGSRGGSGWGAVPTLPIPHSKHTWSIQNRLGPNLWGQKRHLPKFRSSIWRF